MPEPFEKAAWFDRRTPFPLRGDAYTVAGEAIAGPRARERSVYNVTNRRSPADAWPGLACDSRMVFFGLSHWVRECLRPGAFYYTDPEDADRFMGRAHSFGGRLNFDPGVFRRIDREWPRGNLPLRVQALPEGSVFWPNEPVVQVTSLGDGYGEIAALVEANLLGMVAGATARATVTRHLLEWARREVALDNPEAGGGEVLAAARWLVHDFGMRASLTPLESVILGEAHLLSFNGTDTTPAAHSAWASSGDDLGDAGTSILAHAHRIVLGYDTEGEAVGALADAAERCGGLPIASYLADTFDFRDFVTRLAIPLALKFRERGRGVVVVRPDSGDYLENDEFVLEAAYQAGLCGEDTHGLLTATHLKVIHGDGMTPEKMRAVFERRRALYVHATSWGGFGVGGWLRAQSNRDVLSSAYKLAECGHGRIPVVKLSETPEKRSVPGEVDVYRDPLRPDEPTVYPVGERDVPGRLATYYDGSLGGHDAYGGVLFEPFHERRRRASDQFDAYRAAHPRKGSPACPTLSDSIRAFRDEVATRRGKNSGATLRPASRPR